jgi:hypothetical protein
MAQTAGVENNDIAHVVNKDKKYLSEHGQKLFNAINILLDDNEQLELTQALFKYQSEHNVFTLVRSCRELFDTPRKKSLMLFMRPVIPVKDRFHYDEYYKLFFPEEFPQGVKSIFADLIPQDLLDKTIQRAIERNKQKLEQLEKHKEQEQEKRMEAIKLLEKVNHDLNLDIQRLMAKAKLDDVNVDDVKTTNTTENTTEIDVEKPVPVQASPATTTSTTNTNDYKIGTQVKIAGFRIIDLEPGENESLGFDICMGPTRTFIMISYVEPGSSVEKLGMKIGDELVSVNDVSFKMMELEQAIEILSTEPKIKIVLQTSGFMPENVNVPGGQTGPIFLNKWVDSFNNETSPPEENKSSLKRHIRRIVLRPNLDNEEGRDLGFSIRGGFESGLGIFISKMVTKSVSDLHGLRVCDQIIECNGQKFIRILHKDAVEVLKNSLMNYRSNRLPIKLTVRYLAKLPLLNCSNSDNQIDTPILLEKNKDKNQLNEKVQKENFKSLGFKTGKDFLLFKHYLNEYLSSKCSVQYLLYLILNRVKLYKNVI